MTKYWGKQIFSHGSFPIVGQKQKTERKKEREKKTLNDGSNNGQLHIANANAGDTGSLDQNLNKQTNSDQNNRLSR